MTYKVVKRKPGKIGPKQIYLGDNPAQLAAAGRALWHIENGDWRIGMIANVHGEAGSAQLLPIHREENGVQSDQHNILAYRMPELKRGYLYAMGLRISEKSLNKQTYWIPGYTVQEEWESEQPVVIYNVLKMHADRKYSVLEAMKPRALQSTRNRQMWDFQIKETRILNPLAVIPVHALIALHHTGHEIIVKDNAGMIQRYYGIEKAANAAI